MSIFSSVAGGMHDRGELRLGQRQQMAEAFAKFKANNPLATVKDFQNFIDSFAGGNNYIAGGAPGEAVLKRIAASNRAKEAERKRNLAMANFGKELEFINKLSPRINAALLGTGMKDGKLDFGSSYANFLEQNPDLKELDINIKDMFSPWRYDQMKSDLFAKSSPQAYEYLENAEDPDNIDLSQFARMYTQGNEMLAKELLDIQKTKYNKVQTEKLNAEVEKWSDKFNALVNSKNTAGQFISPDEARAMILSQIEHSPFKDKLKGGDWLTKTYKAAQTQSKNRIAEDKANDLAGLNTLLDGADIRGNITKVIRSQGKEEAKDKILEQYGKALSGEYWKTEEGKQELSTWLDEKIAFMVGVDQETLDGLEWELKDAIQKEKIKTLNDLKEQNVDKASKIFSGGEAKILAGNIAVLPTIANNVASRWYMDERTTNLILQFAQDAKAVYDDKFVNNPSEMTNALELFLQQNGGTPLSQMQAQIEEMSGLRPMSRTTFGDYKKDLENHISTHQTTLMEEVNKIVDNLSNSESRDEYESAIRVLNNLKTQYKSWTQGLGKTIERNYDDRRRWRDIDGKQYDVDVINNLFKEVENFDLSDIDAKIEELTNTAKNLQRDSTGNEIFENDPRTKKEQDLAVIQANINFQQNRPEFMGIPVDAVLQGMWQDRSLTNKQSAQKDAINLFFKSDRARNIWRKFGLGAELADFSFSYDAFIEDPLGFISNNPKAREILIEQIGEETYEWISSPD